MPRNASFTGRTVGAVAALALGLTALAACSPDVSPSAESSVTSSPVVSPSATSPAPAPTPVPEPEPEPEPEYVVLNAAGVGGIAMGTSNPQAALEALLGPAEQEFNDIECGPGDVDGFQWGALSVRTLEGALWGWDVQPKRGALPANVRVESNVTPYQPLSDALALPGATGPDYLESLDMLYVEAGGVAYYGQGSDPATANVELVGVNVITCG